MATQKEVVGLIDRKIRATVEFDIIVPKGFTVSEFLEKCFNGTRLKVIELKGVTP